MDIPCNEPVSDFELLGRSLVETPSITNKGKIREEALYPYLRKDEEPGREHLFTNKISVVRLCRGQQETFKWTGHVECTKSFLQKYKSMTFRGFLLAKAYDFRKYGLVVKADASPVNPYHAHIILPDYDVTYREKDENLSKSEMFSNILPFEVKSALDRIRRESLKVIIDFTQKMRDANKNKGDIICDATYIPCTDCMKERTQETQTETGGND